MKDWIITIGLILFLWFAYRATGHSIEVDVIWKGVLIAFGGLMLFYLLKWIWNVRYRPDSKD